MFFRSTNRWEVSELNKKVYNSPLICKTMEAKPQEIKQPVLVYSLSKHAAISSSPFFDKHLARSSIFSTLDNDEICTTLYCRGAKLRTILLLHSLLPRFLRIQPSALCGNCNETSSPQNPSISMSHVVSNPQMHPTNLLPWSSSSGLGMNITPRDIAKGVCFPSGSD